MGRLYRYHPRKRGPVVPQADQAPYLSYWVHPVNQPLRRKAKVIEVGGGVSSNATNAPYLSNWVHATNQPLRNRTPRRQQPTPKPAPFYGIPAGSNTPTNDVGFWIQEANQPLRNRLPKRQQPQSPFWNVAPMRPFQTNFDMERLPPTTAAQTTTSGRWIDGTVGGNTGTPYGWSLFSGAAGFDTSTFHSGSASMKLSTATVVATANVITFRNNPPSPGWLPTETFPLLPSTRYIITGWAMTNNVVANSVFIDFRQYSATGTNIFTSSTNKLSGTNGWTLLTQTIVTDPACIWGGLILRINIAGNVSDAWFDDITVTVLPDKFQQPTNQPLRNRVPKRLQLPIPDPPLPPLASQAPYLSYWKQPVNQPQRNNARKRQQPTQALQEPFYGIPTGAATPSVASWIHPTNQPLRSRTPKRQQLPASEVPPTIGSPSPYLSYWKQPTNEPLKSRVSKRQQPPSAKLTPASNSQAPYLSYWVHPVNQPLKSRVPKRQQPRTPQPPIAPQGSAAPYLSYWVHPVNQPLKSRTPKRQQPAKFRPTTGFNPSLPAWKKAVNQPYRGQLRRRTQPVNGRGGALYAATAAPVVAPVLSSWVHPTNQRLRSKPQYRQAALRLQPLLNLASAPASTPIWAPETDPTGSVWIPDDSSAVIWVPDNDPASTWNPE